MKFMKFFKIFASIILLIVIFIGCLSPDNKDELKKGEFFVCDTCEFDSLIVKYKEGVSIDKANSPLKSYGEITTRTMSNNTKVDIVKIDRETVNVENLLEELNSRTDIEYAEPNYIAHAASIPNDPYYQYQWHLAQLNMPDAWDIEMGDSSVKVAVLDTGVAYNLSDLSGTNFDLVNDKDFINNDMDAYDDNAHGTHCAGTIAQTTNNNSGVAGMAPGITILPIKVLADCGGGPIADIADGVIWATDHDADIISMSLSGPSSTQTLLNAVEYAYNNGVTIFAATGNANGSVEYPAAYNDYVIAVGATRYDKARAPYSNYGSAIDIVAPGGDISVDQNNDGYVDGVLQQTIAGFTPNNPNDPCAGGITDYTPGYYFYDGTSMACPHAAGLGALLKSHNPNATPDEIREAIENTAEDLGSAGWDQYYGHGLIDPVAALNYPVHRIETISDSVHYWFNRTDIWTIDVAAGTEINLELSFIRPSFFKHPTLDLYLYGPPHLNGKPVATAKPKKGSNGGIKTISYDTTKGVGGTYEVRVVYNNTFSLGGINLFKHWFYDLILDWYEPAS